MGQYIIWLVFATLTQANSFNDQITANILASGKWNGTNMNNYCTPIPNRYGSEYAFPIDTLNYKSFFTSAQIDSCVAVLDSSFIDASTWVQDSLNALSVKQRAATVSALRSSAYQSLQGITSSTTLTSAQIQIALKVFFWDINAVNPATGKIDSAQNYIK